MKIKRTLLLVSLIAALAQSAYAADIESSDTSFTVTGTETAGAEVRLSIFDKAGKMLWIDSQKAGEDGKYSFSFEFDKPDEKAEYDLYLNGASQKLILPGNADAMQEIAAASDDTALEAKLLEYADRFGYDFADWQSVSAGQQSVRNSIFKTQLSSDGVKKAYMSAVGIAKFNDAAVSKDRGAAETALVKFGDDIGVTVTADKAGALTNTQFGNLIVKMMSKTYTTQSEFRTAYTTARTDVTAVTENGGGGGNGGGKVTGGSSTASTSSPAIVGAPVEKTEPFTDLDEVDWAKDSILSLYNKGIVSGKGYKTFAPNDDVKREEFVAMLVRMLGLEATESVDFTDVAEDAWYKAAVDAAFENGIISGISETSFGSGMPVTREDCAVICKNVLELYGAELSEESAEAFADDEYIADYAKKAVYQMRNAGVISGVGNNSFSPKSPCSRAMAAKIIDMLGGMV